MPRKKEDNLILKARSRKKIIIAALELFGKYGYAQTPVDHIAKKAKVSKGLIYHYFRSKQEILGGIFNLMIEENQEVLKAEVSPKKYLKKLVNYSVQFITDQPKTNRMMIALAVQPDVIRGLKKEIEQLKEQFLGRFIQTFAALGYDHPETEAYLFTAMLDGMGIGYLTIDDYPLKKMKKLIEEKYEL